jgi:hypothetical protein
MPQDYKKRLAMVAPWSSVGQRRVHCPPSRRPAGTLRLIGVVGVTEIPEARIVRWQFACAIGRPRPGEDREIGKFHSSPAHQNITRTLLIRPRGADVTGLRPVDVVEEPKFFEGDRLVSGCPSGLAHPSNKFYIAISMTYVFAVLFGLASHFGTKLGTPKPAVVTLETAANVRSGTLFKPMMRPSWRPGSAQRRASGL